MSKTTWHVTMSLDGFIAGPEHSMEWARGQGGAPSSIAESVRTSTGAILAGRRWHDVAMERYDGVAGIYGGADSRRGPPRRGGRARRPGPARRRRAALRRPGADRVPLERVELGASGQLTSMRFRVVH
jgi:hypothetical protein